MFRSGTSEKGLKRQRCGLDISESWNDVIKALTSLPFSKLAVLLLAQTVQTDFIGPYFIFTR